MVPIGGLFFSEIATQSGDFLGMKNRKSEI